MGKIRKYLNDDEAISFGFIPKPHPPQRHQSRYYITPQQWQKVQEDRRNKDTRRFIETTRKIDKNGEVTSTIEKLQDQPLEVPDNFEIIKISENKTTGQQWVQYAPKEIEGLSYDFIEEIVSKYSKPIKVDKVKYKALKNDFDTLTYTDVHIGMDTDKYDNTMYQNEWDADILMETAERMVTETLKYKKSNKLIIDDLGDLMDGYNGQTTRAGHSLPQNMTNEKAFDVALHFKLYVITSLIPHYDKIICNNICNDNHAGSFGYFVNSAFKQIAENMYKNVEVNNHRKFINHYYIDDVCFLITHGKDDKALKFGFKVFPNAKAIEKIDQYCKHHKIYSNSQKVIFKKGDSHQCLFDMCSSDDFYYYNYPALAPSSNWVKTNFKLGRRGFVLESFSKSDHENKTIFL